MDEHGTAHCFRSANCFHYYGCRNEACVEAYRSYHRARRERAKAERQAGVPPPPYVVHGSANAYNNHYCRCDTCKAANTRRANAARAAKRTNAQGKKQGGAPKASR